MQVMPAALTPPFTPTIAPGKVIAQAAQFSTVSNYADVAAGTFDIKATSSRTQRSTPPRR